MERYTIFCRTEAGEIAAAEPKRISDRHERAVLAIVDGRATLDELIRQHGDENQVRTAIQALEQRGLVETIDARIQRAVEEQPTIFLHRQKKAGASKSGKGGFVTKAEEPEATPAAAILSASPQGGARLSRSFAEPFIALSVYPRLWARWIGLAVLLLVMVGLVWMLASHFMASFDANKPQLWLGQNVHYKERNLAFRPLPVIELHEVSVGEGNDLIADRVWVEPDAWNWITGRTKRLRLHADTVSATPTALARLGKIEGESTWKVSALDFQALKLSVGKQKLPLPKGELEFAQTGALERARVILGDGALIAEASPGDAGQLKLLVRADNWEWKSLPAFKMERLIAEGTLTDQMLNLDKVGGNAYGGGAVSGGLKLTFEDLVTLEGSVQLSKVRAIEMLARFYPKHTITGAMDLTTSFSGSGAELDKLDISSRGQFAIRQGSIEKLGLLEGVRRSGTGLAGGGMTYFERMDGTFIGRTGAATSIRINHIDAGALQSSGQFNIAATGGTLKGGMWASLQMPGGDRRSRAFALGGTVDSPRLTISD